MTASATRVDGSLQQLVDVNGRHTIVTDEPESLGGTDAGPTPHELLPASIAACISTMICLYADRKAWNIGEVRVDADYEPATDPHHLAITIHLRDGLSPNQLARLRRVAATCPVRRALEGTFVFDERICIVEGEPHAQPI